MGNWHCPCPDGGQQLALARGSPRSRLLAARPLPFPQRRWAGPLERRGRESPAMPAAPRHPDLASPALAPRPAARKRGGQTPQRQPEASASLFLPQLLAWPTRASQWLLTSTGLQRKGQRVAAISERVAQPGNHKPIWVTGPSGDQAGPWLPPPHTGH